MDVERIRKVNDLAMNLMKQGLVTDRQIAISQAEKIYDTKSNIEPQSQPTIEPTPELTPEQIETTKNETQQTLSQNQIEEILAKNTKFIVNKFLHFEQRIKYLENEISELKTKVALKKIPTASEIRNRSTEINTTKKPEQQPKTNNSQNNNTNNYNNQNQNNISNNNQNNTEQNKKETPKTHPRSGNYIDEDVSIEKFFYMGNK